MFTDSGTGDQAASVFYTVADLPSPGRYSLRADVTSTGHDDYAKFRFRKNGVDYVSDHAAPGGNFNFYVGLHPSESATEHVQELLLDATDVLSFVVESSGTQSYSWQVELRLCRMPEDLIP